MVELDAKTMDTPSAYADVEGGVVGGSREQLVNIEHRCRVRVTVREEGAREI